MDHNRKKNLKPTLPIFIQPEIALDNHSRYSVFEFRSEPLNSNSAEIAQGPREYQVGSMSGGFQRFFNTPCGEEQPADVPGGIDLEAALRLFREDASKHDNYYEDGVARHSLRNIFSLNE